MARNNNKSKMGWSAMKPVRRRTMGPMKVRVLQTDAIAMLGCVGRYTVYAQRGEELARAESESSQRQCTREVSARRVRMCLDISRDE